MNVRYMDIKDKLQTPELKKKLKLKLKHKHTHTFAKSFHIWSTFMHSKQNWW